MPVRLILLQCYLRQQLSRLLVDDEGGVVSGGAEVVLVVELGRLGLDPERLTGGSVNQKVARLVGCWLPLQLTSRLVSDHHIEDFLDLDFDSKFQG